MKAVLRLLLSVSMLCACTIASAGNYANLPYGPNARQRVDLYIPSTPQVKGVLIWMHPGGWKQGTKEDQYQFVVKYFSSAFSKGMAVINAEYRVATPESDGYFPNSANDISYIIQAVESGGSSCSRSGCGDLGSRIAWAQAKKYAQAGITVAGTSAGGYLAVMGGRNYLSASANLKCIYSQGGPMDLRKYTQYPLQDARDLILNYARNDVSKLASMSPALYAENGALSPFAKKVTWILNYNQPDQMVPLGLQTGFTDRLRSIGANVIQNIADDYLPDQKNHAVTDETQEVWMSELLQTCFDL